MQIKDIINMREKKNKKKTKNPLIYMYLLFVIICHTWSVHHSNAWVIN